jgi:hypothetical protein
VSITTPDNVADGDPYRTAVGSGRGVPNARGRSTIRRGTILMALVAVILVGAIGVGRSVGAATQQASPRATAGHPLVGTWIVDPEVDDQTNPPSFDVYMADGTAINIGSEGATAGAWEATGPRTATLTYAGLMGGGSGTAFILRANIEVDETGERYTGDHSFTVVAADETILGAAQGGTAGGTRFHAEPPEAAGQSLPGFPTWTPATPEASPPT